MSRVLVVFMIIVSLLAGAQARTRECGARKCARACCADMACCASQSEQAPQPAPAPAPQRDGMDQAAPGLVATRLLFELPPVEIKFAGVASTACGHALPRLAVSCIRLI